MVTQVKNVLGSNALAEIQHRVLEQKIPWYFGESTAYRENDSNLFDFSFSHLIFGEGQAVSPLFDVMLMTFLECLDKADQKLDTLYRMRLGLITPTQDTFVHSPHIDMDTPHKTGLFYVNSADGDTILYDNVYDENCGLTSPQHVRTIDLSVLKQITPVENTFVSFDGYRYHSSSTPTVSKKRIVLNCNYTVMPT